MSAILVGSPSFPIASVVLVSSNPTNLVLSGAFSVSFLSYAAHVVLPFLAASVCVYPLLLFLFRSRSNQVSGSPLIPKRIDIGLSQEEVRATLVDTQGAIFGSVLLLVTLGVLVGVSTIGVPVWEVTVPPAVIMLLRDLHHDWTTYHARNTANAPSPVANDQDETRSMPSADPQDRTHSGVGEEHHELQELSSRTPTIALPLSDLPSTASLAIPLKASHPFTLLTLISLIISRLTKTFPTVTHVAERLPTALLPFAFLMFILVQGLSTLGWVELFARWWAAWVARTGVLGAVGGMGLLSCLFCNVSPPSATLTAHVLTLATPLPSSAARTSARRSSSRASSSSGRSPPIHTHTRTRTRAPRQSSTRAPGTARCTHSHWARTSARSR